MTLGIIERNPTVNDMKRAAWINAMTRNVHTRLCSSFTARKSTALLVRIASPVGRATSVGGNSRADIVLDLAAQRRDGIRAGEVVAHDDVGAGRVEVHELRKIAPLQQQHVLRDQVRVVGNDLERRIAAIHLAVHLPDVVRDGDRLADLARPGQEILEAGDLAEDLGILDAVGPAGIDDDVEIERAAEGPAEVRDALPHDRILREQGEEIRVDPEAEPADE